MVFFFRPCGRPFFLPLVDRFAVSVLSFDSMRPHENSFFLPGGARRFRISFIEVGFPF